MNSVVAAEWFKVRRRRMTWVLLGLVPIVMGVLYTLLFVGTASAQSGDTGAAAWEARLAIRNVVTFGDAMVYRPIALFCVILAGSMMAGEFSWRTVLTFAAWTGDRRRLLVGKLAAVGLVGVAYIVAAWLAVAVAVVAGNTARGTFDAGELHTSLALDLARGMAITWAAAMVFAVITVALAVFTRSAAAAIAVPLGILLMEPLGAALLASFGGLGEAAANLTLSYNIDSLLATNGAIGGAGEDLSGYPPVWRAGLMLGAFCALTAWLAARALGRRDLRV